MRSHYLFFNLELYFSFHINPFEISIGSICRVVLLQAKCIPLERKQPVNLFQIYPKDGLIPSRDIGIFIPSWQVFLHISNISLSLLNAEQPHCCSLTALLDAQALYHPHTFQFFHVLPRLGDPEVQKPVLEAEQKARIAFVNLLGALCLGALCL